MTKKTKPRTVIEWVEENSKDYADHEEMIQACAMKLNVQVRSVRTKISLWKKLHSPSEKRGKDGISREHFRAQFDKDTGMRLAIWKGISTIGSTEIVSDNQFRAERCGNCGTAGWRQVAEEEEFLLYQFRCGSRIWWATKATVKWTLDHVSKAKGM